MLLVISALFFYQCQKETSFSLGTNPPPGQVITTNPLKANLQGNILDETGQPAAGVVIKVGNDITVTDDRGID